jgi:hypothetical protein
MARGSPAGCGIEVPNLEVERPKRQNRHRRGKSDAIDAEAAAPAVQAGTATAQPKSGDGPIAMLRMLQAARRFGHQGTHPGLAFWLGIFFTAGLDLFPVQGMSSARGSLTGLAGVLDVLHHLVIGPEPSETGSSAGAQGSLNALAGRASVRRQCGKLSTLVRPVS